MVSSPPIRREATGTKGMSMGDPGAVDQLRLMRAYASPERLRILAILRSTGPQTVSELGRLLGVAVGSASHHLHILERSGLVGIVPAQSGDRRQRWWGATDAVVSGVSIETSQSPLDRADTDRALWEGQREIIDKMITASDETWEGTPFAEHVWLRLTPRELAELHERIHVAYESYIRMSSEHLQEHDDEAKPVYFMARGGRVDP